METRIHASLGKMGYKECLELQRNIHLMRQKDLIPDCLLIVEHLPVFTLGIHAAENNLLVSPDMLKEKQVDCVRIERGGDITFHGPGQMVAYPIFKVDQNFSVKAFISDLEAVMIKLMALYGINGEQNPKNRGVWIGQSKIGFVGIAVKKGVTLHGIALNVAPDLEYFSMINPCGMAGVHITSLKQVISQDITVSEIEEQLETAMSEIFEYPYRSMDLPSFRDFLDNCTKENFLEA